MSELEDIRKALLDREEKLRLVETEIRKARTQLDQDKKSFAAVVALKAQLAKETSQEPAIVELENPSSHGAVKAAVAIAIRNSKSGELTSRDVASYLLRVERTFGLAFDVKRNRANISAYMRQFADKGMLEVIRTGSGSQPIVYRRCDRTISAPNQDSNQDKEVPSN